jgi:hypothetical protein
MLCPEGFDGTVTRTVRRIGYRQEGSEGRVCVSLARRVNEGNVRGGRRIRTFATTANALLKLRDWLVGERVSQVAMKTTGDYE